MKKLAIVFFSICVVAMSLLMVNLPEGFIKGDNKVNAADYSTKTVVFIPGVGGSSLGLGSGNDFRTVWPPDVNYYKKNVLKIIDDMKALKCDQNGKSKVKLSVTDGLNKYYKNITNTLEAKGYKVYVFNYDWRSDIGESSKELLKFIKNLKVKKVNLIGHSMGGLVAARFLQDGNEGYVNKFITLGTPYLGSAKTYWIFETGEFFGDRNDLWTKDYIKGICNNFLGVYELLPTENYLKRDYYLSKNSASSAKTQAFNTYEMSTNFLLSKDWVSKYLVGASQQFHKSLYAYMTKTNHALGNVDSYFILGTGIPTFGRLTEQYDQNEEFRGYSYDDIDPVDGDGTVATFSGNVNGMTYDKHTYYVNTSHGGLINNSYSLNQVYSILSNNADPVKNVLTKPKEYKILKLYLGEDSNTIVPSNIKIKDGTKTVSYQYYDLRNNRIIFFPCKDTSKSYSVSVTKLFKGYVNYKFQVYDAQSGKLLKDTAYKKINTDKAKTINFKLNIK